jgi:uncharacterized protein (TIGR02996 family)
VTDRDSLLSAVLASPADDTARLVFADFLEENGEPGFGRFLRAGVAAGQSSARHPLPPEIAASARLVDEGRVAAAGYWVGG